MKRRLRILELMCGAGGSAEGYARAGFEVVGVDIAPQPRFPFRFVQMDVFEFLHRFDVRRHFDVIHASPPCQGYSSTQSLHTAIYPKLIKRTRRHLDAIGLPYVIENVEGARGAMHDPIRLCGSSFGLRVRRHRLFECSFPLTSPPPAYTLGRTRTSAFTPSQARRARPKADRRTKAGSSACTEVGRGSGLGSRLCGAQRWEFHG